MKRAVLRTWLVLAAAALVLAGPVQAQESKAAGSNLKQRIKDWQARQNSMGEATYSTVTFDQKAFEQVFGHRTIPLVRFGVGWYPVKNLCLEGMAGGIYQAGYAVGALSGKSSGESVELYVLPLQLNLRYRFAFLSNQIVVPSVWAGVDYWPFKELNQFHDNYAGDKSGWHWGADVAFLLDPLDPDAAHHLKRDYGIAGTYLVAGYESLEVGEAEGGLKFSGTLYSVGLRFEVSGK